MKKAFVFVMCLAMFILSSSTEKLRISYIEGVTPSIYWEKALNKMGYLVEFKAHPNERSLRMTDSGEFDGENARIREITEKYTNLIVVDEPIESIIVSAYTQNNETENISWEKLRSCRVAGMIGEKIVENNLKNKMKEGVFYSMKNYQQCIRMVEDGKVDYAVFIESSLEKFSLSKMSLKKAKPALEKTFLYPILNKKHSAIADELAKAIREVKKEDKKKTEK